MDDLLWNVAAVATAVLVIMGIRAILWKWSADQVLRKLPVPPGSLPFLGHALKLGEGAPWDTIHKWIVDCGREEDKGMIKLDFLMTTGVVISHPDHIKHVFSKHQKNYPKDNALSFKPFLDILGTGIVTSHGDSWKRQRRLVAPAFRFDILEETTGVAKAAVDRLCHRLEKYRGTGKSIELAEEFRVMTLQVIGELILSLSPEESARVFPKLYLPIVEEANRRVWEPWRAYLPTPHHYRYRQTVKALNEYVGNLIRERWAKHQSGAKIEKEDILDRVLQSLDPKEWGEHMVRQLTDEIKTFLLAGHETSASMLTWSLFELCKNPHILEKVKAEGRDVFADGARGKGEDVYGSSKMPPQERLKALTYTVNTLKESLRLYTLVPMVVRICAEDDEIDGQAIPAGSKIFMLLKATHLNDAIWPKPQEFKPERFEEAFDIYNFNAFINGPRNCLGQHLALLEARIVLSLLVQRFKFTIDTSKPPVEVHNYMVPTCPADGMHILVD
jgi:cytochrome P450